MPNKTIDVLFSGVGIFVGYKIIEHQAVTSAEVFQNLLNVMIGNALVLFLFAFGVFTLATGASLQLRKRDELKWRPIVGFGVSTFGEGVYPLFMVKLTPFTNLTTMVQTYTNYVLLSGIIAIIIGAYLIARSRG